MSPCWVKIKASKKNEVLSKDTGQSGKVSLGRWQCRGSWVSWESRVEGEMSQLIEPVMILRQEIVWQVSEEHQKSPRSWNWVEEGESGSKDGNLVSSCVDIGHSRLGWNEGIGGFNWHVFIYVLRISLWCWGTVASRSFKSTQRELQGDCYSSYQTKDHGGLHSAASRGCHRKWIWGMTVLQKSALNSSFQQLAESCHLSPPIPLSCSSLVSLKA